VGFDQGADFWKVEFKLRVDGDGKSVVSSLLWAHDIGVPAVEYYRKE
jgi:hypothetical protein